MHPLDSSQTLPSLVAVAFMLGLRHGFDADHLAAIDGMTRFNALDRPALARRTGLWFSLGHGAVVLAVAVAVSMMATRWAAPDWLEPFGAWISIGVLVLLGLANLDAVRRTPADIQVNGAAWRSRLFARVLQAPGRWPIMGVGALFALSFDTLSQAALMAVTGTALRGLWAVLVLTGAFVSGMVVTDGLNGWWVARLLRRPDRLAARASRVMGVSVACASLGTALLGIGMRCSPALDAWAARHGTEFSLGIVAMMFVSFLLGHALAPSASAGNAPCDAMLPRRWPRHPLAVPPPRAGRPASGSREWRARIDAPVRPGRP
jgi:high-affinity nickel-transport protein